MKPEKETKLFNLNYKIVNKLIVLSYYYEDSLSRTIENCIETQYNILRLRNKEELEEAIGKSSEIIYNRMVNRETKKTENEKKKKKEKIMSKEEQEEYRKKVDKELGNV